MWSFRISSGTISCDRFDALHARVWGICRTRLRCGTSSCAGDLQQSFLLDSGIKLSFQTFSVLDVGKRRILSPVCPPRQSFLHLNLRLSFSPSPPSSCHCHACGRVPSFSSCGSDKLQKRISEVSEKARERQLQAWTDSLGVLSKSASSP